MYVRAACGRLANMKARAVPEEAVDRLIFALESARARVYHLGVKADRTAAAIVSFYRSRPSSVFECLVTEEGAVPNLIGAVRKLTTCTSREVCKLLCVYVCSARRDVVFVMVVLTQQWASSTWRKARNTFFPQNNIPSKGRSRRSWIFVINAPEV